MKTKILTPLVVIVSLALPATAMAMQYAPTYTGNKFASKTQSGTCVARKELTTAVLRCSGTGSVTVRYPFRLKAGCGPAVVPSVVALGDSFMAGTRQDKARNVQVWIRIAGQARLTISTVTLRYYCN
jgi:hypothetical protein